MLVRLSQSSCDCNTDCLFDHRKRSTQARSKPSCKPNKVELFRKKEHRIVFCIPRRLFPRATLLLTKSPSAELFTTCAAVTVPYVANAKPASPSDVLVRRRPRTVEASRSSACWVSNSYTELAAESTYLPEPAAREGVPKELIVWELANLERAGAKEDWPGSPLGR